MANQVDRQITEEGPRNAVVKLTGYLDISDIVEAPAIAVGDFSNNDPRLTLEGFRIDLIEYSISNGVEIRLDWNSTIPQQIYLLSGRGKLSSCNYGGFIPDATKVGYDGSINLTTFGFDPAVPQSFSIVLELVKLYSSK